MKRKDIEISVQRYLIDALGAMAQGLFCSLLVGTIISTIGTQFRIPFLTATVATIAGQDYTVGGLASAMSGPAMAVAIGYALHCPPLVLFSLVAVGFAANALGGAGGPLAVLFIAIFAAEFGKAVSKETKVDILVTPLVTIGVGIGLSAWWAPALGAAASEFGTLIMWATNAYHVGHGSSAVSYGNCRFCSCRHGAHASDFVCGHLCSPVTDRPCGRRCGCRLLRADDRLCGHEF